MVTKKKTTIKLTAAKKASSTKRPAKERGEEEIEPDRRGGQSPAGGEEEADDLDAQAEAMEAEWPEKMHHPWPSIKLLCEALPHADTSRPGP